MVQREEASLVAEKQLKGLRNPEAMEPRKLVKSGASGPEKGGCSLVLPTGRHAVGGEGAVGPRCAPQSGGPPSEGCVGSCRGKGSQGMGRGA